jgi:hypothetical protein
MIVVRLTGGLGNQMFQYAFGRCLADRHADQLYLELGKLSRRHTPRQYALKIFNINARITTMDQVHATASMFTSLVQSERGFHQHYMDKSYSNTLVVEGYWVTEKYFVQMADLIREEFTFKSLREGEVGRFAERIRSDSSAVCLHVRRGDYLTTADFLGFVGTSYYERAIMLLKAKVPHCHFYVFSDDIDWCKSNLMIDAPHTFVEYRQPEGDLTEADFQLMTTCRHFITANSTYSWWAAWLAAHRDSAIVTAPVRWFKENQDESKDIVPSRWIRL